jgi:hypothetical protein
VTLRALPALVAALLALTAPAAHATAETGIADDRVLLAGGAQADAAVTAWADLGVDTVRIHAMWSRIAPDVTSTTPPASFDAADPNDPHYDFAALDAAIDRVRDHGLRVMLTVTGPGPLWSSSDPGRGNPRWKPDPSAYADFAHAVVARYGDQVDRYILWNEPNLPQWLQPQSTCTGGHCTATSPHIYRALVRAALPAIKAADPGAQVLIGALGPRGLSSHSTNAQLRPLEFLRAFGCVDRAFHAIRTGGCRGFRPASGDAFAYHPHGILNAPGTPFANSDDVDLASLPRLEATLDRLQRAGALRKAGGSGRFSLYLDEYGYQTNPPDHFLGVAPAAQDRWLQEAAYRVWRDPRVRNLTQYAWIDEPVVSGNLSGWQSGLRYADGRAKPALAHFATPFFLDAARGRLWGQVRPGSGSVAVKVERRLRGSSAWRTVATVTTDGNGFWSKTMRLVRGASYRFATAGQAASMARTR